MFKKKHHQNKFNRCGDLDQAWFNLQTWYQTPLGKSVADCERQLVTESVADLFGYHLLQVGRLNEANWLSGSRVSHCEVMDFPPANLTMNTRGFQGVPESLPIQTDSMDVIVLPHVLEFSQQPHAVLREVERVLIPEGHVLMLVFNPWSNWLMWRWLLGWRKCVPWCGRFLSTTRIKDWLALLGFDIVKVKGYYYRPPVKRQAILERLQFWETAGQRLWPIFGAANLIVARKRVVTVTPIRERWRPKTKIVATGLVEPFQQHQKRDKL